MDLLAVPKPDHSIELYDMSARPLSSGLMKTLIDGDVGHILCLCFSRDASVLAVGSVLHPDCKIMVWDVQHEIISTTLVQQRFNVSGLAFPHEEGEHSSTRLLSISSEPHLIQLWDLPSETVLLNIWKCYGNSGVSFASSDTKIVVQYMTPKTGDRFIYVWNARTNNSKGNKEVKKFPIVGGYLAFSADGAMVADMLTDIVIFDVLSGKQRHNLLGANNTVECCVRCGAFSNDSDKFAAFSSFTSDLSSAGEILVWEIVTAAGDLLYRINNDRGEGMAAGLAGVWTMQFNASDTKIACGSVNYCIYVVDLVTTATATAASEGKGGEEKINHHHHVEVIIQASGIACCSKNSGIVLM